MNHRLTTLLLGLALIASWSWPQAAYPNNYKELELNQSQWEKFKSGEMILKTRRTKQQVWPKITIYSLLKSPPRESIAIFSHFEHQKSYIPGLLQSQVVKVKKPNEIHTKYEMDLPWPLSNSHYIHGTILSHPKKHNYHLRWYDVRSDSAEDVSGQVTFTPLPKSLDVNPPYKTLMVYKSHMVPKSFFAGILRDIMVKDVQESIRATREEIHRLWMAKSPLLKKAINILDKSLSGQNPYPQKTISTQ